MKETEKNTQKRKGKHGWRYTERVSENMKNSINFAHAEYILLSLSVCVAFAHSFAQIIGNDNNDTVFYQTDLFMMIPQIFE